MTGFRFWLGTHQPGWLARPDINVPLFVSHNTLRGYKTLPRAVEDWACDSGAFSEVRDRGADAFTEGPKPYVAALRRYHDEIGRMAWAAGQDWMCEPFMLARTGLTVWDHLDRTVANAEQLDHQYLNEVDGLDNPTAENLARWIWARLAVALPLAQVVVRETCTAGVAYTEPLPAAVIRGYAPDRKTGPHPRGRQADRAPNAR